MLPEKPLPYSDEFGSADAYVAALLDFASTSSMLQILCGGVHILDFYTIEAGLFSSILPPDWQTFLLSCDSMELLDLLMRDDLADLSRFPAKPPDSLLDYIKSVRRLSLNRAFSPAASRKVSPLKRRVAVGMKVKKVHEVTNFADYVDKLCDDISDRCGQQMTHLVDFGSGQNYLGRTLASPPYHRNVIAVERRKENIEGARVLDVRAGLASRQKVMRNKKLWMDVVDGQTPEARLTQKARDRIQRSQEAPTVESVEADLRDGKLLDIEYAKDDGGGSLAYVEGTVESGDLSELISKMEKEVETGNLKDQGLSLMAISIHSCGNLSHHGIRSLVLNPRIRAVAIVGCCYNLLTEKLGAPTFKHPYMRPTLQAPNGKVMADEVRHDPHGFPMSERFSTYNDDGIRLNITARMMACQAPYNWTEAESDGFFTRHFFRAVLQRIFLERGAVSKVYYGRADGEPRGQETSSGTGAEPDNPFATGTNPVIIGSLRPRCYESLHAYVRAAVHKLTTNPEYRQHAAMMQATMGGITDDEIAEYEARFQPRRKEISIVWSLMAFSALVVEALIVADRWQFLSEHADVVRHCWVETVFDYAQSPRNLVVVGVKA